MRSCTGSGTFPDMVQNVPAAFQALLDERGLSVSGASTLIGHADALGKMFARKARSMRTEKLALLADRLEVTMDDLARMMGLSGVGEPRGGARGLTLPVRYQVEAGAYRAEDLDAQAVRRRLPIGPDPRYPVSQWLEEVRGDSINRVIPEGGYAQVADWAALGAVPRDRMLVVARAVRYGGHLAERTIKRVRLKGSRIELWPESTNPKWSEPILVGDWENPVETDDGDEITLAGLVVQAHIVFSD